MDVEGLPAQKKQVHSLVARWTVMNWLSRLQVQSKSLETSDYEVQFYNPFEQKTDPALSYDEFLSFFKNLYDEQDLQRWKKLGQFVKSEYKEGEILNRDQFILHAYSHWSDQQETSDLETIYKEILKSVDEKFELTYKDWVDWAEKIATQKEKTITDSIDDGVEIGSLMSDHSAHVTHRIFLGVCEEDFRTTSISFVSSELRNKITQDLGFSLEDPEQNFKHFQVRWLLQRKSKQTILSIGLTDFDGALLTPLSLWYQYPGLDSNGGELVSASYKESRWDRLQKLPLHEVLQKERKQTEIFIQSMQSRIEMDGGLVREPSSVTTVQTISPSRIESYLKCPFIYKSQKVYRLSASPEIDIDVDPMTRGQFVHEMFEKILTNLKSDWSDQKINELIESIKVGRQLDYYQDQLWLLQKRKYFHLAQKFINFEKRWHQQYPETENHKTEIKWSVGFDFTQKIFKKTTAQDLAGVVEMNGQIDRIDISTHQQISVIDYKSSLPITSSFTKWIEKNNLQLIFYAWVVDRGFVDGINGEMVNASYYNFKDFSRDHGFQLEQAREKFLPTDLRPSQKMTEESKSNLFEEFEKKLIEVMGKIQAGEFQPQPFDLKECVECEWKKLCRAPHLN